MWTYGRSLQCQYFVKPLMFPASSGLRSPLYKRICFWNLKCRHFCGSTLVLHMLRLLLHNMMWYDEHYHQNTLIISRILWILPCFSPMLRALCVWVRRQVALEKLLLPAVRHPPADPVPGKSWKKHVSSVLCPRFTCKSNHSPSSKHQFTSLGFSFFIDYFLQKKVNLVSQWEAFFSFCSQEQDLQERVSADDCVNWWDDQISHQTESLAADLVFL